jgi:hypothetical protein
MQYPIRSESDPERTSTEFCAICEKGREILRSSALSRLSEAGSTDRNRLSYDIGFKTSLC